VETALVAARTVGTQNSKYSDDMRLIVKLDAGHVLAPRHLGATRYPETDINSVRRDAASDLAEAVVVLTILAAV